MRRHRMALIGLLLLAVLGATGCTSLVGRPTELTVFPSSHSLSSGEAFRLRWALADSYGTLLDSDATEFVFESSAPLVASVEQDGTVWGLSAGRAVISVTYRSEASVAGTCDVHVTAP